MLSKKLKSNILEVISPTLFLWMMQKHKQKFYLSFRYILLYHGLLFAYSISLLPLYPINGIPVLLAVFMCSRKKRKGTYISQPPLQIGIAMRHRTGQWHESGNCCWGFWRVSKKENLTQLIQSFLYFALSLSFLNFQKRTKRITDISALTPGAIKPTPAPRLNITFRKKTSYLV